MDDLLLEIKSSLDLFVNVSTANFFHGRLSNISLFAFSTNVEDFPQIRHKLKQLYFPKYNLIFSVVPM